MTLYVSNLNQRKLKGEQKKKHMKAEMRPKVKQAKEKEGIIKSNDEKR